MPDFINVHDDPAAQLPACPRPIRQLAVYGAMTVSYATL